MAETFKPENASQLAEAVAWAVNGKTPLEVIGSGSKRGVGRPVQAGAVLDASGLAGITLYEPHELVLSAGAGSRRADIEAALGEAGQEFAFEPPDLSRLLGSGDSGTLGGMIAANLAGPRRLKSGAARDHFLGFTAVSGRAETFQSGGRVMKNVTGYDMSKLMAGSWGTLAVMSDVTFKVLPACETVATVAVAGLSDQDAMRAMSIAMQSSFEVSGAAHLPAGMAARSGVTTVAGAGQPVTVLRLEGFEPSVASRLTSLESLLKPVGVMARLDAAASRELWREIRDVHYLSTETDRLVWRVSVPPMEGARVLAQVRAIVDAEGFYDWAGGLLWLSLPAAQHGFAEAVRGAIAPASGHATLIRGPHDVRAVVPVFDPQPPALAALSERVRAQFDPAGILNPGRMYRSMNA